MVRAAATPLHSLYTLSPQMMMQPQLQCNEFTFGADALAPHCNILQLPVTPCNLLQLPATHCNSL